MRIAQFVNTLDVTDGGPARNAFELNISLNQIFDITAQIYSISGTTHKSVLQSYGGSLGPVPRPGPLWLVLLGPKTRNQIRLWNLYRAVRDIDIAVIHGYYLPWTLPLALCLKLQKIPYVITPHGSLTEKQQKYSKRRKLLFDMTAGFIIRIFSAGFVTGSASEREDLQKKHNNLQVDVGGVGTPLPQISNEKTGWGDPLILLSMSRIASKKRIDISIETTALLRQRGINAELHIAGTGGRTLVKELETLSRERRIYSHVHFIGQKTGTAKTEAYQSADFFVLPSEDENFGIGLAEALAHGVPAVVSAAVASAEVMPAKAGVVIAEPTPELMANAIVQMMTRDRESYAYSARNCAKQNFSWPRVAENWVSVLQSKLCQSK